jgi:peptidoglycan/LPS O-acetylase OafA/YrhL
MTYYSTAAVDAGRDGPCSTVRSASCFGLPRGSPLNLAGADLPSEWRLGHRPSLDALRGIAVLLVLLGHFGVPGLAAGGTVGVALFFALSGYLITGLLLAEWSESRRIDVRAFYIRRARRLLPALAVLLAAMAGWAIVSGQIDRWLPGGLAVAFYVGNWAWIAGVPLRGIAHAWSLAVEEQFYLLWPLALIALLRRGPRLAIGVTIGIIVLSFAATALTLNDYLLAFAGSDARAKDLLVGCLVALVSWRRGTDVVVPTVAAALASGVLAIIATASFVTVNPVLTAIPCGMVVAWMAARPRALAWPPLLYVGLISYGLYLYHYPFAYGPLDFAAGWPWVARTAGLGALTVVLAWASFRWIESPIRARRRSAASTPPQPVLGSPLPAE